jgi:hypothetical protein
MPFVPITNSQDDKTSIAKINNKANNLLILYPPKKDVYIISHLFYFFNKKQKEIRQIGGFQL